MSAPDPLSLFHALADAFHREDWPGVAALCDAASLARFKRDMVEQHARPEPAGPSVEELLRYEPEMPREVAEYHVARTNRLRESERPFDDLPGIPDADALVAAPPERVFAAWLEGRSPRRQIERLRAAGEIPDAAADEAARALGSELRRRFVALGAVPDGERIAYVVFREEHEPPADAPDPEERAWLARLSPEEQALDRDLRSAAGFARLAICRLQEGGEWRVVAGYDFLGLGAWTMMVSPDVDAESASGEGDAIAVG